MSEMSVIISSELEAWIKERLAEGRHADASAYIRELIQRDQHEAADAAWVREKVAEGLASGFIEQDAGGVIRDIVAERRARRG